MLLYKARPENIAEFALWLRNAIDALQEIQWCIERDLSHFDVSARLVAQAERHARYVGAQALCDRCRASFRLHPEDGPLLSPEEGLTILGECLSWCLERAVQVADQNTEPMSEPVLGNDGLQLFPNGKPFLYEDEATDFLGLPTTTLRDARLRGEIEAGKFGRRHTYTLKDLRTWHENTKNKSKQVS